MLVRGCRREAGGAHMGQRLWGGSWGCSGAHLLQGPWRGLTQSGSYGESRGHGGGFRGYGGLTLFGGYGESRVYGDSPAPGDVGRGLRL